LILESKLKSVVGKIIGKIKRNPYNMHANKRLISENRVRLKNTTFTLFADSCNGAFITHDLGVRYNSPFVNLTVQPEDFIRFLKDPKHYLNCEMQFVKDSGKSYPVGMLDDIKINFIHYETEEEALKKWSERPERIDFENCFLMLTNRGNCSYRQMQEFDALPYKNKVIFTNRPYPELACTYYLKGWEKKKGVGELYDFKDCYSGKKHYDDFDYVTWFNEGKIL